MPTLSYVTTRAALKAINTTVDTAVYLAEGGREGTFVWKSGDYSSEISIDTGEGVYVKANAIAATSGSWVRAEFIETSYARASWFGEDLALAWAVSKRVILTAGGIYQAPNKTVTTLTGGSTAVSYYARDTDVHIIGSGATIVQFSASGATAKPSVFWIESSFTGVQTPTSVTETAWTVPDASVYKVDQIVKLKADDIMPDSPGWAVGEFQRIASVDVPADTITFREPTRFTYSTNPQIAAIGSATLRVENLTMRPADGFDAATNWGAMFVHRAISGALFDSVKISKAYGSGFLGYSVYGTIFRNCVVGGLPNVAGGNQGTAIGTVWSQSTLIEGCFFSWCRHGAIHNGGAGSTFYSSGVGGDHLVVNCFAENADGAAFDTHHGTVNCQFVNNISNRCGGSVQFRGVNHLAKGHRSYNDGSGYDAFIQTGFYALGARTYGCVFDGCTVVDNYSTSGWFHSDSDTGMIEWSHCIWRVSPGFTIAGPIYRPENLRSRITFDSGRCEGSMANYPVLFSGGIAEMVREVASVLWDLSKATLSDPVNFGVITQITDTVLYTLRDVTVLTKTGVSAPSYLIRGSSAYYTIFAAGSVVGNVSVTDYQSGSATPFRNVSNAALAVFLNAGTVRCTSTGKVWKPVDSDTSQISIATNANFTLTWLVDPAQVLHTGTLTATRAVTLSTTGAVRGARYTITRTGGGAFNLNVGTGPLKSIATNGWASFTFDGTAWYLSAAGTL